MWDKTTLDTIVEADDLKVAPFRADGKTTGTPTWIWCVQVEGNLYVRAYSGTSSRWYQSALQQKAGQIHAAGNVYDVNFAPAPEDMNDSIDNAYRTKYAGSSYLSPMVSERARLATVCITPV
ncbi:DUF2255 family protein [Alteromonas lipolytica]|uniref:DUF2255 domain-containing protein n=1 Tax=Alteromonas lipolytica TaxID=1856405 RepID=A0A1E8F926_9ALTE|nr:DUF2255 family protein [Alteromonas lipolytica]OFI32276.1 hypothetical protein BFC17_07435 [Alteromonas lipolytica]GGF85867.1 hypothetical protein GCM10011338_42750 [Alteromonas lipolytica]